MAKPDVQIGAPTRLVIGRPTEIEIVVTAPTRTRVDYIEARIEGRQGWTVGSGKHRVSARDRYPLLITRLLDGPAELAAGEVRRFTMPFTLPGGTAPTHDLDPAHSRLWLRVHISIPWRIDGRYHYAFEVRVPPPAEIERAPVAIRSTGRDAAPDKPRIEVSLAASRVVVGERVAGSVAVFHLDDRKPREVELALVPVFALLGRGRPRERRGTPIRHTITLPAGSAGRATAFELPLSRAMVPSFRAVTHELSWWLVARSGSLFGGKVDVALPLAVYDAAAASRTDAPGPAPRLGDERIAVVFATAAARAGWRGANEPDDGEEFAIARALDDAELSLGYAYRGELGTFVVARIEHRSLGLGLRVTPSSRVRHWFWQDIEADLADWDREHHVTARAATQARPFLAAAVPTLARATRLGALAQWDDDALVVERAMSEITEDELVAMIRELEQVAAAIAAARPAITPPPGIEAEVAAWRELARWLDGSLGLGDLSIQGTLDGLAVELGLAFLDGDPVAFRASVGDPTTASELLRRIDLTLPRPAADVLATPGADDLVDPVTRWPADFRDLRVADGIASATWLLPSDAPPRADTTRVRELVEALRGVIAALVPATAPYR